MAGKGSNRRPENSKNFNMNWNNINWNDTISYKTLKTMDACVKNMASGKIGDVINIERINKELKG